MGKFVLVAVASALSYAHKNGRSFGLEILVNVVLPFITYSAMRPRLGDVGALLAASIAPIGWSIIEFVRRRRIDGISLLVVAGIVLSLLAFIGGGSARFLQLRENLVTGIIGLIFLVSAAIGKPLIYQLARASMMRQSPDQAAAFEENRGNPHFRQSMTLMTIVWGTGFLLQTAVACILVFRMPIARYLLVSPFIGYGTVAVLALWTVRYVAQKKRLGAAREAARSAQEPVKE